MLKGIDVSRWQGDIDWKKVKAAGIQFAILKAGGADDGYYTDSKFEANYKGAKEAGIPVGCYYFNSKNFVSHSQGIKEAEHFASIIKGKTFEFPVYCDVEAQSHTEKEGITSATIAFCQYMENAGYWVGIYGSDIAGFSDRLNYDKIKCYATWVARYGGSLVHGDCGIRQTSDSGKVDGISTPVDLDEAYIDYSQLIKAKGLNNWGEIKEEVSLSISMPSTIKTYKKGEDIQLSKNFHLSEFTCKCGKYCSTVTVDLKLVAFLQAIRDHFGKKVTITSGFRCATHNANVGGARNSYHTKGRACDFIVEGVSPLEVARFCESINILGIGHYDGFCHCDTRTVKFFWYSSAEIPRTTFGGTPIKVETPKVEEPKEEVKTEPAKAVEFVWSADAKNYDASLVGSYKTTASGLHCRKDAGTKYDSLCIIKPGDCVLCLGNYTAVDGVKWLQVLTCVDGKIYNGFSSSKYLKKV